MVLRGGRRRWSTAQERRQWIEAWERSQQSQAEFARSHGLSVATLRNWVRREAAEGQEMSKRPQFVEVDLGQVVGSRSAFGAGGWEFEIRSPNGWTVAVAAHASMERVQGLLEALGC